MGASPITVEPARRHSVPCEAPVMVDAGQFWCKGQGAEISTEQLTLTEVRAPLMVGTGVDVYFELGGTLAIETRAVVTQSEGDRVTLHFLDLDAQSVHDLESYVAGGLHSTTQIRRAPLV